MLCLHVVNTFLLLSLMAPTSPFHLRHTSSEVLLRYVIVFQMGSFSGCFAGTITEDIRLCWCSGFFFSCIFSCVAFASFFHRSFFFWAAPLAATACKEKSRDHEWRWQGREMPKWRSYYNMAITLADMFDHRLICLSPAMLVLLLGSMTKTLLWKRIAGIRLLRTILHRSWPLSVPDSAVYWKCRLGDQLGTCWSAIIS